MRGARDPDAVLVFDLAEVAAAGLGDTGVVRLAGPDALRFANGMFTNDIRDLAPGAGNRSAVCDEKGRITGMLSAWRVGDQELILVVDAPAETFAARLGRFAVFDDVEIEVIDARVVHVAGGGADEALAAAGFAVPREAAGRSGEAWVLRRDRTGRGGFDVVGPGAALSPLDALPRGAPQDLEVLRVEAGKPRWPVDFGDKALVHVMGLRDEVCHFEKGCYVGQEVIHRTDVMGKVRKRLAGVRVRGEASPGAEVRREGEVAGVLTSVVRSERFGVIGLGVLWDPAGEPGTALDVGGAPAVASALPFHSGEER